MNHPSNELEGLKNASLLSDEGIDEGLKPTSRNLTTEDTLMDLVRNCFPPNIIQATTQQYKTMLIYPGMDGIKEDKDGNVMNGTDKYTWKVEGEWKDSTNILGKTPPTTPNPFDYFLK